MKITKVEPLIVEDPYYQHLFVRVETENGPFGMGECWWGIPPTQLDPKREKMKPGGTIEPIAKTVDNILEPLIIGHDADRIERLWERMIRISYRYGDIGILRCAVSGIDLALWDLKGKTLGVPIIELLGGRSTNEIRAYASLPPLRNPEVIRHESKRAMSAGFKGIKLHEYDPKTAGLVRDECGPDMAIMFDVNGRFTPHEATGIAKKLISFDVTWFEEPIWPMRDHQAMAQLKKTTGIRIATGENEWSLEDFHRLMTSECVDYVMPEITKIGGMTAAQKIKVLIELKNLTLSPHGYRIGPGLYANVHLALSCEKSDWLEIPFLPNTSEFPVKIPLPPLKDGMIGLPDGPGLGLPRRFEGI